MKKKHTINLILAALLLAFSVVIASAQNPPDGDTPRPPMNDPGAGGGNLLRELGLTQDQIRMIRTLNAERRPLMQDAQRRQRIAMRELDQAIYADAVDEPLVLERLKQLQLAQAEFSRIKATNELEVRKILTPEQLTKFRELRQRMLLNRPNDQGGKKPRPAQGLPRDRPPNDPNRRPGQRPRPQE